MSRNEVVVGTSMMTEEVNSHDAAVYRQGKSGTAKTSLRNRKQWGIGVDFKLCIVLRVPGWRGKLHLHGRWGASEAIPKDGMSAKTADAGQH